MRVYYNEIDPYCRAWLKNLMDMDVIPTGEIDGRSIEDVKPNELMEYNQCHFFAGIGVWAYAIKKVGYNGKCWTGSCPCQPFSTAGKGKGFTDERHLWPEWKWLISQCKPNVVIGEQVSGKKGFDWFSLVQSDLEMEGYQCAGLDLPAGGFGAPHKRNRLFWTAINTSYAFWREQPRKEPCSGEVGRMGGFKQPFPWNTTWESALSRLRVVDDGTTAGVSSCDAIRNSIAAPVAKGFLKVLVETLQDRLDANHESL